MGAVSVFDFDKAIVRSPATSVTDGLRAGGGEAPCHARVLEEHRAYVAALEQSGVEVETLPPLEAFPDSVFVEDPAFILTEGAILLRPGAATRIGETAEIAPALRRHFGALVELDRGFADGGDILVLPDIILIGLSARTDRAGAERFVELAAGFGRRARIVETPPGVLHLKTGCALLDEETVVATAAMADGDWFAGMHVLTISEGEEPAANLLRVNRRVLAAAAFPRTLERIAARGHEVVPLEVSEIGKIDAGLSCMSLRWRSG